MLNDIKDWAIEKGQESQELAKGVATEVQTTGVMDWSGTVWLVIGAGLLFCIIGLASAQK